ncbi:hypothetical protein RCL1_006417 [Eukaryota sp. TZLM3-RCL]
MNLSEWHSIASLFQFREELSETKFLKIVALISQSKVSNRLLKDVLSFGLVCFPSYNTFHRVGSLVDDLDLGEMGESLLPYITAASNLQSKSVSGSILLNKVMRDRSYSNRYALLGLLYHVQLNCHSFLAFDYFCIRSEFLKERLFLGVWRCLFTKLESAKTISLVSDRICIFSDHVKSLYYNFIAPEDD